MDGDEYDMNHENRGYVLIINIESFMDNRFPHREGSIQDVNNLRETLPRLGFDFAQIHVNETDYSQEEFITTIRNYINTNNVNHTNNDCFFCFIMSHGRAGGVVYSADCLEVRIKEDIVNVINGCETLQEKPKIFFIQACRRALTNQRIEASLDDFDGSDYCVCYSTIENQPSLRDIRFGGFYIIAVCKIFREKASHLSFSEMITLIEYEVKEQIAEHNMGLNKLMYFKKDNQISSKLKARLKFFGRKIELETIKSTLANKQGIIISGSNGIGKTALANEYGHRVRDEQNVIVRFLKCKTKESLENDYRNFSNLIFKQKLDPNIPIDEIIFKTNKKLNSKQMFLVIFDNVSNYDIIEGYIKNTPLKGLKIIITTSNFEMLSFNQTRLENMFSHLKLSEIEINEDQTMRDLKDFINLECEKSLSESQMENFINKIITDNLKIHPKALISKINSLKLSDLDKLDELIYGIKSTSI